MFVTKNALFNSTQYQQGLECEISGEIYDEMFNILPPLRISSHGFLFGTPDDCKEFTSGSVAGKDRFYCQIKRQLTGFSVGNVESWCVVDRNSEGLYRVLDMDHDVVPLSAYAGVSAKTIGELYQAVRDRITAHRAATIPLTA